MNKRGNKSIKNSGDSNEDSSQSTMQFNSPKKNKIFLKIEEQEFTDNKQMLKLLTFSYDISDSLFEKLLKFYEIKEKLNFSDSFQPRVGKLLNSGILKSKIKSLDPQFYERESHLDSSIFKWRMIEDDGNSFFRSIMFCYIESIIQNQKIDLLENILMYYYSIFKKDDFRIRNLNENLKEDIISYKSKDFIQILCLIKHLLSENNKDLERAYQIFYLAILHNQEFDKSLIFYLRFLIYDYLLSNSNSYYSKSLPILIGNLLPKGYETQIEGEFDFGRYYEERLLKMNAEGDPILNYLIPYVLKCNLKLIAIIRNDTSFKDLSCFLQEKPTISIVYSNNHYDICVNKETYENLKLIIGNNTQFHEESIRSPKGGGTQIQQKGNYSERSNGEKKMNTIVYKPEITGFNSPKNNFPNETVSPLKSNGKKNTENISKQYDNEFSPNKGGNRTNKFQTEKIKLKRNSIESEESLNVENESIRFKTSLKKNNLEEKSLNVNNGDMTALRNLNKKVTTNIVNRFSVKNFTLNQNQINSPNKKANLGEEVCSKCKLSGILYPEVVSLCYVCLETEIKFAFAPLYLEYCKKANELLQNSSEFKEINVLFQRKFDNENSKPLSILGKKIPTHEIEKLTGKNIRLFIEEFKSIYCNICQKVQKKENVSNSPTNFQTIILNCGCFLCSKSCLNLYNEFTWSNANPKKIECICGFVYSVKDLLSLYKDFKGSEVFRKKIKSHLLERISFSCFRCQEYYDSKSKIVLNSMFFKLRVESSELESLFKDQCYHLSCMNCYNELKIKSMTNIECTICSDRHYLEKLIPISGNELRPKLNKKEDDCMIF